MTNYRVLSGSETNQVDAAGRRAEPNAWYYEPSDYEGDVLWSEAYCSRDAAEEAALDCIDQEER